MEVQRPLFGSLRQLLFVQAIETNSSDREN